MTDQDKIAEFLARKGATKVPAGSSKLGHMTGRDWAMAARSTTRINADAGAKTRAEWEWEMGFAAKARERARGR